MPVSRLQMFRTGVSNRISDATTSISNGATNVSNKVKSTATGVLSSVSRAKSYVVTSLTISEKNKAKIKNIPRKIMDFIKKIMNFIKENNSLIFFGLTVLFSYHMASVSAFEYLAKAGLSLTSTFVSGMTLGTGLLALKNILFSYPRRNTKENKDKTTQDDKINYLLGIANLCQIYINPAQSLATAIGVAGLVAVKTAYKCFLPADEIKKGPEITFLVPTELSQSVDVEGAGVAQA
ncbi:MAG: hypothetical protein KR126chlam4_00946 [Candidatus Anoxychlamydiales bacterium]|nr:hypothetical protein [Candidatus Anoxychlamydiales bacterium]